MGAINAELNFFRAGRPAMLIIHYSSDMSSEKLPFQEETGKWVGWKIGKGFPSFNPGLIPL